MDKETADELQHHTDRIDAALRGIGMIALCLGGGYEKRIYAAMSGEDRTSLMLEAAAECLSPEQYDAFLSVNNGDTLTRLYHCIQKRMPV